MTPPTPSQCPRFSPMVFILAVVALVATLGLPRYCSQQANIGGVEAADKSVVTVYFSRPLGQRFVQAPVRRKKADPKESNLAFAMKTLLEGPTEAEKKAGFSSEIPKGTELLGIQETDKAVYINLSKEFATGGGSASMLQRLGEVSRTAKAAEKKRPIYLKLENQPLKVLGGEGLEVPQPLT